MKKATLIAVLALTILVATSASAFAVVNTATGNFQAWDAAHAGNGNGTPHIGFSTTSEKCAVCHSVHNADYAGGNQNILLRSSRNEACVYCHVSGSVSSNKPYGNVEANYTTDTNTNHSDDPGPAPLDTYAGCASCHSVHGANTYTDTSVATAILRNTIGADTDVPAPTAGVKAEVLTEFCSQCHPYYPAGYDVLADGEGNHIMTATINNYSNTEADSSVQGTAVAAAGSATCQACHDAVGTGNGDSFPHYMPNNARFVQVADAFGGTYAGTTEPSVDGACIKCHLWTAGADGVGQDF
jgi:cytochrome c553